VPESKAGSLLEKTWRRRSVACRSRDEFRKHLYTDRMFSLKIEGKSRYMLRFPDISVKQYGVVTTFGQMCEFENLRAHCPMRQNMKAADRYNHVCLLPPQGDIRTLFSLRFNCVTKHRILMNTVSLRRSRVFVTRLLGQKGPGAREGQ